MEDDRLRYMAEQIARNFAAQGEEEAAAATADHIATFWDPRMKAQILAMDRATFSDTVAAALDVLRRDADPPHQTRATEFNKVDEDGHSDAG